MYTRQEADCPESFVQNGKPVFGTFRGHPQRLDIRGVAKAYMDVPLPLFITNLRIKSRLSYFFNIGGYIGCIEFFDAKLFGYANVIFWNTATRQRFSYHSVMGPRRRFVPHKLDVAATSCYRKARYIRLSWDRHHNKLSIIFNLRGDKFRPNANAALVAPFDGPRMAEATVVTPAPTLRRCSARYYASLPVHGSLSLVPRDAPPITMPDADGVSFFDMNRTYMKFITRGEFVTGLGTAGGKQLSFRIEAGSQDAVDQDKYNGNVLFCDGEVTPLPPVVITHPFGIMNKWVIQDTENMIDLTFTPISDNINVISVIFLRAEYHTIYGTFDGALLTARGEKIPLRSLPGLTKKYVIRL